MAVLPHPLSAAIWGCGNRRCPIPRLLCDALWPSESMQNARRVPRPPRRCRSRGARRRHILKRRQRRQRRMGPHGTRISSLRRKDVLQSAWRSRPLLPLDESFRRYSRAKSLRGLQISQMSCFTSLRGPHHIFQVLHLLSFHVIYGYSLSASEVAAPTILHHATGASRLPFGILW